MHNQLKRGLFAALMFVSAPLFAADVGVSISVAEPGVYGRIDIGDFPSPPVIYREPVVVEHVTVIEHQQPVYMHVPPGHAKDWPKHCHKYNACARRVYFVEDNWYESTYVPHEKGKKGKKHKHGGHDKGHGKGHGKGKD